MFVTEVNDLKIYNLSAGKSIPDWISDRKRRTLQNKNVDIRKRIELIQDFSMPGVATCIRISRDGQFILAAGTYKPRVKCFEVNNLSIKFERCFDSEVTAFEILSDDYSKLVFLHCDRYVEVHAAHGRHYRLRIPRFGRDMSYHVPTCDLFIAGTSSDIYRLNLERGQFLLPYQSEGSCLNAIEVNPEHHLICVGTQEGTVEAWDPRDKKRCGKLDVAMKIENYKEFPSVSALTFKNGLQIGVGTSTGQVLVYDIRAREPLIIKDHYNKLPIKKIGFNLSQNSVYSMDGGIFKVWNETDGKQLAYIESSSTFNDFATIPNTGMLFFAQEEMKMLTYYIPALGPAPRWCSFLDNLTEEMESDQIENIYDDYKFVTKQELGELGLDHLIGTNLLRAYMHGYFIDMRLYKKAKTAIEPFQFEKYRKEKIRQQIEEQRPNRLQIKTNLPKVNQEMAIKLLDDKNSKKKAATASNLLDDNRFKAMFENPDFEIDKSAEQYKMLAPVINRMDNAKMKQLKKRAQLEQLTEMLDENGGDKAHDSDNDDDLFSEKSSEADDDDNEVDDSSDDEGKREFGKEMKKQYRSVQKDRKVQEQAEEEENMGKEPKMYEIDAETTDFKLTNIRRGNNRISLGGRLAREQDSSYGNSNKRSGNRSMVFSTHKSKDFKTRQDQLRKHKEERRKVVRSTKQLKLKRAPFK